MGPSATRDCVYAAPMSPLPRLPGSRYSQACRSPRWAPSIGLSIWMASLAMACSTDPEPTAAATAARYQIEDATLDPTAVPFPNDLFLRDGHLEVDAAFLGEEADAVQAAALVEGLGATNGFSVASVVFFPVDGAIDPDSLSLDGAGALFDLQSGERLPVSLQHNATRSLIAMMLPHGRVLRPGGRYAAVLSRVVAGADGRPLARARTFEVLASAEEGNDIAVMGSHAEAARTAIAEAADVAARGGLDGDEIVAATTFTVGEPTTLLQGLVDRANRAPVPSITEGSLAAVAGREDLDGYLGVPAAHEAGVGIAADVARSVAGATRAVAHDAIVAVVRGTFEAPSYLYEEVGEPDRFRIGADGLPEEKRREEIPFLCALPICDGVVSSCADHHELPIVMFQHGTGISRADVLAVADAFAHEGLATCGIDLPFHGSRLSAVDRISQMTGAPVPDGIGDTTEGDPLFRFYNLSGSDHVDAFDMRAWRDAMRQAALDGLAFARLLRDGDLSGVGRAAGIDALTIRPGPIAFVGESLGSMVGTLIGALDPQIGAMVLSVSGGGLLTHLAPSSPGFGDLFVQTVTRSFGVRPSEVDVLARPAAWHPLVQMLQTMIEPGDPLAFIQRAAADKHLLLTAVHGDQIMPNQAAEAFVIAAATEFLDYSMATPGFRFGVTPTAVTAPASANLNGRTMVAVQFEPASHGVITRPHGQRTIRPDYPPLERLPEPLEILNPTGTLQAAAAHFLVTYYGIDELDGPARGDPVVVDPITAPLPIPSSP